MIRRCLRIELLRHLADRGGRASGGGQDHVVCRPILGYFISPCTGRARGGRALGLWCYARIGRVFHSVVAAADEVGGPAVGGEEEIVPPASAAESPTIWAVSTRLMDAK